jgi:hypothetical protein
VTVIMLPFFIVLLILFSSAIVLITSAMHIKYRDIGFVLPQCWRHHTSAGWSEHRCGAKDPGRDCYLRSQHHEDRLSDKRYARNGAAAGLVAWKVA